MKTLSISIFLESTAGSNASYFFSTFLITLQVKHRWRTTKPGDVLERRMEAFKKYRLADLEIAQYIAPFSYTIRRKAFQFLCLIVSIYNIFLFGTSISSMGSYGLRSLNSLRFVQKEAENPVSVTGIKLLFNGCDLVVPEINGNISEPLYLANPVFMNGFKISGVSRTKFSSIAFILLGSLDNWTTSFVVGSSDLRWGDTDVQFLENARPFEDILQFDYRPRWGWYVIFVLRLVAGICLLSAVICAHFNRPSLSKVILTVLCSIIALGSGTVSAGYFAGGLRREAIILLVDFFVFLFLSSVLATWEILFPLACLLFGFLSLGAYIAAECSLFQDCGGVAASPPLGAICLACWGAGFIFLRLRLRLRSLRSMEAQQGKHDAEWLRVSEPAAIAELDSLAESIARDCLSRVPRQCAPCARHHLSRHRNDVSSLSIEDFASVAASRGASEAGPTRPLRSLDQLYSQVGSYRSNTQIQSAAVHCKCFSRSESNPP